MTPIIIKIMSQTLNREPTFADAADFTITQKVADSSRSLIAYKGKVLGCIIEGWYAGPYKIVFNKSIKEL